MTFISILIDLLIQGSLISYYFLDITNFAVINVINSLPVLFTLFFILVFLSHVVLTFMSKNEKEEFEKVKKQYGKRSQLKKAYNAVTDTSLGILLIITGHPILLVLFVLITMFNYSFYNLLEKE